MKTIILHFEWKLCGIMRIFMAPRFANKIRLISDRFFDNEFSGVEFELILEIYKTLTSIEGAGIVGIWLRQIGPTFTFEEVNTKYRIYAIKDNKRVDISRSTNKLENKEMGYDAIKLDKVVKYTRGPHLTPEGDLYLHCDVEITLYNPIKNLQDNYKKILDDGLFTDCVLKVGDEEIKAHRCILVQNNEVFKSMFADNGMLESQNCIVNISDTTPVCVRALLEYFYTGRINIGVLMNHVDDLFVVADKYQVTGLKFECERFMSNLIDSTNILKYCEIINLYGSTILEDACKDFVRVNWRDFFHCKEWEDIQNNYPKLAFNFMQFVIEDFDQTKNNYVLSTT